MLAAAFTWALYAGREFHCKGPEGFEVGVGANPRRLRRTRSVTLRGNSDGSFEIHGQYDEEVQANDEEVQANEAGCGIL